MASLQAKRAALPKDLPKENERIGLTETGVYDTDIYGGKGKFEGYNYSIASQDDDEVRLVIFTVNLIICRVLMKFITFS